MLALLIGEGWLVLGLVLAIIATAISWALLHGHPELRDAPVSTDSASPRAVVAADAPTVIMSRDRDRELAMRYQAIVQLRFARLADENATLKSENARLKIENAKAKQFSEGQRLAVREFLERERTGKQITRTTVTRLLGKDSAKGFVLIGEELEKIDKDLAQKAAKPPQAAAILSH